jgi:hypothetical protein
LEALETLRYLFFLDGSVLYWRCWVLFYDGWVRDVQVCLGKKSGAKNGGSGLEKNPYPSFGWKFNNKIIQ